MLLKGARLIPKMKKDPHPNAPNPGKDVLREMPSFGISHLKDISEKAI